MTVHDAKVPDSGRAYVDTHTVRRARRDVDVDLDRRERFSLLGEVAGAYSLGPDPHDVHATLGVEYSLAAWFDLTLVGFFGFLAGGDRAGLFFGIAPKWAVVGR